MNGLNNKPKNFLFPNVRDFDMIEAESLIVLNVAVLRELEESNYLPVEKPIKLGHRRYVQLLVRYEPYSYEA